jgi:hypothetical protein
MFPSDKVAQLYPQAPGPLFVAFYDWKGWHGNILTRLHREDFIQLLITIFISKKILLQTKGVWNILFRNKHFAQYLLRMLTWEAERFSSYDFKRRYLLLNCKTCFKI